MKYVPKIIYYLTGFLALLLFITWLIWLPFTVYSQYKETKLENLYGVYLSDSDLGLQCFTKDTAHLLSLDDQRCQALKAKTNKQNMGGLYIVGLLVLAWYANLVFLAFAALAFLFHFFQRNTKEGIKRLKGVTIFLFLGLIPGNFGLLSWGLAINLIEGKQISILEIIASLTKLEVAIWFLSIFGIWYFHRLESEAIKP